MESEMILLLSVSVANAICNLFLLVMVFRLRRRCQKLKNTVIRMIRNTYES